MSERSRRRACRRFVRRSSRAVRLGRLIEDAASAGNILIPLVQELTRRVASIDAVGGRSCPLGRDEPGRDGHGAAAATARGGWRHRAVADSSGRRRRGSGGRHAATPMAGRTWLQQATPTTFGAKAATWLDAIARARLRLTTSHGSGARAAVRRRHRHAVEPGFGRTGSGARVGGEASAARGGHPVAHRARPHRERRVRARA